LLLRSEPGIQTGDAGLKIPFGVFLISAGSFGLGVCIMITDEIMSAWNNWVWICIINKGNCWPQPMYFWPVLGPMGLWPSWELVVLGFLISFVLASSGWLLFGRSKP
jgi:hypothetical protein